MCNLTIEIHNEGTNVKRIAEKVDVSKENGDMIRLQPLVRIDPFQGVSCNCLKR